MLILLWVINAVRIPFPDRRQAFGESPRIKNLVAIPSDSNETFCVPEPTDDETRQLIV